MIIPRLARRAALPILLTLACLPGGTACSTSSSSTSRDGGVTVDSGSLDGSEEAATDDASEPLDATVDQSAADTGTTTDAAPVDAAFACANPAGISDCGYCLTQAACVACATTVAPAGAPSFKALFQCVDCTACYAACAGSKLGCTKPAGMDSCDIMSASPANCAACEQCSVKGATADSGAGSCSSLASMCTKSPACAELLGGVQSACKNLP